MYSNYVALAHSIHTEICHGGYLLKKGYVLSKLFEQSAKKKNAAIITRK